MDKIIDVHCHLDIIKDLDNVIARAKKASVKSIVTSGIDIESNRKSLEYAKKYDIVRAAIGIYPPSQLKEEKKDHKELNIDEEIGFIRKNRHEIVFVGEIGMDLSIAKDLSEQRKLFLKMIDLAENIKKPIIVHSRKAEQQVVEALESTKIKKVIMHCFSGRFSLVKKIEDNGWFLSIPTNIVRSSHFQEIAKRVDINQLLTETDSPFLSPFKDKRNEPSFVVESLKKIAELKGMDIIEVENNIFYEL